VRAAGWRLSPVRGLARRVTFALAMVPVLMLVFVVGTTLVQSREALAALGLGKLFGPVLASRFVAPGREAYGLLPGRWGPVGAALIALALGLPASLSLAIVPREYPVGPLSRLLGGILGLLSGIPPIVYATMAIYVAEAFMRPKFGGWELADIQ